MRPINFILGEMAAAPSPVQYAELLPTVGLADSVSKAFEVRPSPAVYTAQP